MFQRLFVIAAFLSGQYIIAWYGYFMGKVTPQGAILGIQYNSIFTGLLLTQIKFIWIPILINVLYGLGFQWGNEVFRNFLIIISLWIASGPIAALIFNAIVVKEKLDLPIILGIALIAVGSILVVAHKEIEQWLF